MKKNNPLKFILSRLRPKTGKSKVSAESRKLRELEVKLGKVLVEISSLKEQVALLTTGKRLNVAIVGAGGHGKNHIESFMKLQDCTISHVCDVDSKIGSAAVAHIQKVTGRKPAFAQDIRAVLKDPSVDCVAIATPHHWHALAAIWALRAGKHVYLEKPISHTYSEGASVLAAARKYGKVIQSGTQLRSNTSLAAAGKYMREGGIGNIELVHCLTHKDRPAVPIASESKIPATVDFDLWCGPAEKSEVTRSKFHYHWHWLWEFGNGALGNNGIHRIDAVRSALDLKGYGDLVLSCGGRFGQPDSGETPNNMLTLHRYGKIWVLQDILGLAPKAYMGIENGIIFYGSKANIIYKSGYATLHDLDGTEIRRFPGKQLDHFRNFLDAIRNNDSAAVRGDLKEGIISSDLCHFGNISYRTGAEAGDAEIANCLKSLSVPPMVLDRFAAQRANLDDNGLCDQMILGRILKLSDEGEPIVNDPTAAAFLTRKYRAQFEVPAPDNV